MQITKIFEFWLSETPAAREALEPFPPGVHPTLPTRKLPQLPAQPGFCAVPKPIKHAEGFEAALVTRTPNTAPAPPELTKHPTAEMCLGSLPILPPAPPLPGKAGRKSCPPAMGQTHLHPDTEIIDFTTDSALRGASSTKPHALNRRYSRHSTKWHSYSCPNAFPPRLETRIFRECQSDLPPSCHLPILSH